MRSNPAQSHDQNKPLGARQTVYQSQGIMPKSGRQLSAKTMRQQMAATSGSML
jgi:hypothetical protein